MVAHGEPILYFEAASAGHLHIENQTENYGIVSDTIQVSAHSLRRYNEPVNRPVETITKRVVMYIGPSSNMGGRGSSGFEFPGVAVSILEGKPADVIRGTKELGFEDIAAKRKGSCYVPGRRTSMVKYKLHNSQEFVIGTGRQEGVLLWKEPTKNPPGLCRSKIPLKNK